MNLLDQHTTRAQVIDDVQQLIADVLVKCRSVAGSVMAGTHTPVGSSPPDPPLELKRATELKADVGDPVNHPAQEATLTPRPRVTSLVVLIDQGPGPSRIPWKPAQRAQVSHQAHVPHRRVKPGHGGDGISGRHSAESDRYPDPPRGG